MVSLSGKSVLMRKGEPEVSWISRLPYWLKRVLGQRVGNVDDPVTEEFATLSSFTLLPGHLKLRVGVVSVRGNYREHNEDNFYVPGRRRSSMTVGRKVIASCPRSLSNRRTSSSSPTVWEASRPVNRPA